MISGVLANRVCAVAWLWATMCFSVSDRRYATLYLVMGFIVYSISVSEGKTSVVQYLEVSQNVSYGTSFPSKLLEDLHLLCIIYGPQEIHELFWIVSELDYWKTLVIS